ncbi:MAG: uncharacterized protein QOD86_341 [Miltoncostaeaceae bacterium]|nr:uncharacterized protein [Miltoncostaeaceae bacterium]
MTTTADPAVEEVETPHGPARVHLHAAGTPRAGLALGHGAGGGVGSRDLELATRVGRELGVSVALVEQPYRVAGRRGPSPARQLDAAWTAVMAHLRAGSFAGVPLIAGGRSSGARVACRTAEAVGAAGVLCLAFPLVPPGRTERPSRLPELEAVAVPALVVQGERDPFGIPPEGPSRRVVLVAGDHALRSDAAGLTAAVRGWLEELLGPPGR